MFTRVKCVTRVNSLHTRHSLEAQRPLKWCPLNVLDGMKYNENISCNKHTASMYKGFV